MYLGEPLALALSAVDADPGLFLHQLQVVLLGIGRLGRGGRGGGAALPLDVVFLLLLPGVLEVRPAERLRLLDGGLDDVLLRHFGNGEFLPRLHDIHDMVT